MGVDEAVVVRRYFHVVEFRQGREFSAHGESAHTRAVELHDLYRLLLQQRAHAVAGLLALPGGEGDVRLSRENLEFAPVVEPSHGFFEPAGTDFGEQARALDGGGQIPRAVHVEHEFGLIADDLADDPQALHVLFERGATDFRLERPVSLVAEHFHLLAQLGQILTLSVIGAGDVAGDFLPEAAEEAEQGLARGLSQQIPHGEVDCRAGDEQPVPGPFLYIGELLVGDGENLLIEPLGCEGVLADDEFFQSFVEHLGRALDEQAAAAQAEAFQPLVGFEANQQLVRLVDGVMADPVAAFLGRAGEHVCFDVCNLHLSLMILYEMPIVVGEPWPVCQSFGAFTIAGPWGRIARFLERFT